ncbi:hypothetical protein B0J11DRAFT_581588 [Dendryphion nanum]|uniref:Uncharacterized protein n=1 Tax=Dendryphion nanum TaxID=256645 RepID=A0A9P9DJV7_9PLEO|nr:hypothetical protein B0J11DRAFT_581588 [Dendryphion nanum]
MFVTMKLLHFNLFVISFVGYVNAIALIPVPTPAPTFPAVLAKRDEKHTLGYKSESQVGETTIYTSVTNSYDLNSMIQSGSYYHGNCFSSLPGATPSCDVNYDLYTACSSGWLVAKSTSRFCENDVSSCQSDLLMFSYGALPYRTQIYCATIGHVAWDVYEIKPPATGVTRMARTRSTGATTTTAATPSSTSRATSRTMDGSESTSTAASSSSSSGAPASSSGVVTPERGERNYTPVIAGSVVGGLSVIAIAVVGAFFLLRRRRGQAHSDTHAQVAAIPGHEPVYVPYKHTEPAPLYHDLPTVTQMSQQGSSRDSARWSPRSGVTEMEG